MTKDTSSPLTKSSAVRAASRLSGSSWVRRRSVRSALSVARDVWQPASNDAHVEMERVTALVERDLGRLDVAEHLVTSLVRRWNDSSEHRRSVLADIALAELHVRVGEPRGTSLAHLVRRVATMQV